MSTKKASPMIESSSGVNPQGKPFVSLVWGKERAQLSPDEARQFGLTLLEVAEAAEMDATFFDWLGRVMGPDPEALGKKATVLASFRTHREAARAKGEAS